MFAYTIKDLIKNITATDDDDIDRPRSTRRGGPKKHSIFKNDKSSAITPVTLLYALHGQSVLQFVQRVF